MTFNIFFEFFYILVIFNINNVISLRNNKFSSIENPKSILGELGEFSIDLKIIELQEKVNLCSSLISQANSESVSAKLRLAEKQSKTKDNIDLKTEEELVAELTSKAQEVSYACNPFLDLLLLKRIQCYDKIVLEDDINTENKVKEKINNIVNNIVITEKNAPFIRSLIYKVKCHNFPTNEHCKLLTSKLLFYMAITPKETIENFENVKLVDTE